MQRIPQLVLIASTIGLSWLWIQAFHEAGHVLHAMVSGGRVQAVILHPLRISFTDVRPNPRPLLVAWGGVVWGCGLPLVLWAAVRATAAKYAYLAAFFAGFCWIANGAYLAAGAWQPVGDARALLNLGVPRWLLPAIGLPLAAVGLAMWNGLGEPFGLRNPRGEVDAPAAWAMLTLLLVTVALEVALCPR